MWLMCCFFFVFLSASFLLITLSNCVVCVCVRACVRVCVCVCVFLSESQWHTESGVNPLKDRQVRENCRVLLFSWMSWNYRHCLKPDCEALTGEMQSFGKVSTNFFPLHRYSSVWFRTCRGKKTAYLLFFFWQHASHVTLNLWRFPILSDHSLFGSC